MSTSQILSDEFSGRGLLFKGGRFTEALLAFEIFVFGLVLVVFPQSLAFMSSLDALSQDVPGWVIGLPMMVAGIVSAIGLGLLAYSLYVQDDAPRIARASSWFRFVGGLSGFLIWSWLLAAAIMLLHVLPTYAFYAGHIVACFRTMILSQPFTLGVPWHSR
jgi:hypothetical protein